MFYKKVSYYFIATIIGTSLSFILLPIYTNFLTLSDFGILALSYTFGNFLAGLFSFSLSSATNRYYFSYKKNKNYKDFATLNTTNLTFLIIIFCVCGLIVHELSGKISNIIFNNLISEKLLITSFLLGCLSKIFNYLMLIFVSQEKALNYSIFYILNSVVANMVSIILICFYSFKADGRIIGGIFSFVVLIPFIFYYQKKNFSFNFKFSDLKRSLKFSLPLMPDTLIGLVNNSFDKIILNRFLGLNSLGSYDMANRFSNVYKQALDTIIPTWTPYFMNHAEVGGDISKKAISDRSKIITIIFTILAAIVINYIEEIVILLTTKEFHNTMQIIPLIIFFTLAIHCYSIIAKAQILFIKKTKHLFYSSALALFFNISLNLLFIPKFGIIGAVIATGLSGLISTIYISVIGQKFYHISLNFQNLAKQLLIFLVFTIFILFFMNLEIFIFYKIFTKSIILFCFIAIILHINNFNFIKFYKAIKNAN